MDGKGPFVWKGFSSKEKAATCKSLCVVFMVWSFRSVLCDMKMLTREQLDERIIFYLLFERGSQCVERVNILSFWTQSIRQTQLQEIYLECFSLLSMRFTRWPSALPKEMQEAFVCVDFGGGGNDRIFFDGCFTVFIGDVSQPHSAAKSGITCVVEQFRTYMSE